MEKERQEKDVTQEQLDASVKIIIDAAKTVGAYEKLMGDTVGIIISHLDNPPAVPIDKASLQNLADKVKESASAGVSSALQNTPVKVPSSSQLVPVFQEALDKVSSEINRQHPIKGKKWFWISIVIAIVSLSISGMLWYSIWHTAKAFDGTAESWANRMYLANLELHKKNPGAGYDEIMVDFSSGRAELAKEKVIRKENTVSEINQHRHQYESLISTLLEKYYPNGVVITEFEENTGDRYLPNSFSFSGNNTKKPYRFVYMKVITNEELKELRIVMEKSASLLDFDKWNVYVYTDDRINSVADYRKKARKIKPTYSYTNAF